MKKTLMDLVQQTIVLQCNLPSEEHKLKQSHLSNKSDNRHGIQISSGVAEVWDLSRSIRGIFHHRQR